MALHTLEEGKQQYTLKVRDLETKQETLAMLGGSVILTTDHDEIIQYAARMAVHFGAKKIYTVCFVTPIHMCVGEVDGQIVSKQLGAINQDVPTDRQVDDGILRLTGNMKEITIERKPFDFNDGDEDIQ